MARKVRRAKRKKVASRPEVNQTIDLEPVPEVAAEVESGVGKKQSSAEQFRLEYAYVVRDLRRVILLALAMFALLIALNLIIQ